MENLIYFKSSLFQGLKHGFFGRQGGVSDGLVQSLNCYPYVREKAVQIDDAANVQRNRQIILHTLNSPAVDIVTAHQVHGDKIIPVNQWMPMDFQEADGMIVTEPGIPIGILTADCVPILYANRQHTVIGAAHAGWKGGFMDIHLKMIGAMKAMGIQVKDIKVVIGPSIQQASYEVDQGFYDRFSAKDPGYKRYFYPSRKASHYQFDLPRLIYEDLMQAGVYSVDWVRLDTVIHEHLFFSHRRATLSENLITGRQLSVISL